MPITAEQAYKQLNEEMKRLGGWKPGNILDGVIGVVGSNTSEIQDMLNKLLQKKGVLGPQDEAALKALLERSEQERKRRQQIRKRYTIIIACGTLIIGSAIYIAVRQYRKGKRLKKDQQ